MNIIINGFHEPSYFNLIHRILDYFKINDCFLTFTDVKSKNPSSTHMFFHKVTNIIWGDYGVNWEEITPLDEELITQMSGSEAVALRMMDRANIKSYSERKRIYLKHLRYWNHVVETKKINLFFSQSIPHEVYDYVIYSLCKLKGIPTLFFFQIRILDTITMMEDWEKNNPEIEDTYKYLLKKYENKPESDIKLIGRFDKDYKLNTSQENPVHFDMLRKKSPRDMFLRVFFKLFTIKNDRILFLIKNPTIITGRIINYLKIGLLENILFRIYRDNEVTPNLQEKYIYFPLHLQPEATTSPLAGAYVDQILVAQMISYHLPEGMFLYVKENPLQSVVSRDREFYRELIRIPQVRLVPRSFSTFDLINNSLAVATATGTAGWEALYRGKPVLMFGHNFYQFARGVFRITTSRDCKNALDNILNYNHSPNHKELKIFLKALESTTIEGFIDIDFQKVTNISDEVNIENIYTAVVKKIEGLCVK